MNLKYFVLKESLYCSSLEFSSPLNLRHYHGINTDFHIFGVMFFFLCLHRASFRVVNNTEARIGTTRAVAWKGKLGKLVGEIRDFFSFDSVCDLKSMWL